MGELKFCPECQRQGLKSSVHTDSGGVTTDMCVDAFYDKEGHYHYHDPNLTTRRSSCSNGHEWFESHCPKCWCGWGDDRSEVKK